MFYKIVDIKSWEKTWAIYLLVHFWETKKDYDDGKQPFLVNDFYLDVLPQQWVYDIDADGNYTTKDGKKVKPEDKDKLKFADPDDPFIKKIVDVDVLGFCEREIEKFIGRAVEKGYVGDYTSKMKLSDKDPLKNKEKVITLLGTTKDVNI